MLTEVIAKFSKRKLREVDWERIAEDQEGFLKEMWNSKLSEWKSKYCGLYPSSLDELVNAESWREFKYGRAIIGKYIYTSGTTGKPKKVLVTLGDLINFVFAAYYITAYIEKIRGYPLRRRINRILCVYTNKDVATYAFSNVMKIFAKIEGKKIDICPIDEVGKYYGRRYDLVMSIACFYDKIFKNVKLNDDGILIHTGEPLKQRHLQVLEEIIGTSSFNIVDIYASTEAGPIASWFGNNNEFKHPPLKYIISMFPITIQHNDKKYLPFTEISGKLLVTLLWRKTYAVNYPVGDIIKIVKREGWCVEDVYRDKVIRIRFRDGFLTNTKVNRLGSLPFPEDFWEEILGKYGDFFVIGDPLSRTINIIFKNNVEKEKVIKEILLTSKKDPNFGFFPQYYYHGNIKLRIISSEEKYKRLREEIAKNMGTVQPKVPRVFIWER